MYFAHPIDIFCLTNFEKNKQNKTKQKNKTKQNEFIRYGFSFLWVLVLILIRPILEQSINKEMVSKI